MRTWKMKDTKCKKDETYDETYFFLQRNPCENGGTCRDTPGSHYHSHICDCPPGFTGDRCEFNKDDCRNSPCVNGKCIDGIEAFTCKCDPGYTGKYCEKRIR